MTTHRGECDRNDDRPVEDAGSQGAQASRSPSRPDRADRLRRFIATNRDIAHAILVEKDRARLVETICRTLVERGDYRRAWLMLFDDRMEVTGVAQSGFNAEFAGFRDYVASGRRPICVSSAIECNGLMVVRNIGEYCRGCPLSRPCLGHGAMTTVLTHDGHVHGILTVTVPEDRVEDQEEHRLLSDLAGDIAFALHNLDAHDRLHRREAETERELLLSAIEQSSDVIYITDTKGIIQYVNPAFETATGYRREDVIGQSPRLLKSGEQSEAYYKELWDTISSGRTWYGQFVNRRKDGSLYTVVSSISPVRDASGRLIRFVAVNRDITLELKELDEKVRLQDQLAQAQKLESIGRLAGGVAHDFNNTLQVILGHAESILRQKVGDAAIRTSVEEMRRAALHSASLTRQLLAFARQQTVTPKVIDLVPAVGSTLNMLRRLLGEDIELVWDHGPGVVAVRMDPVQVDQIMANLVVNARDAIDGSGRLSIHVDTLELDEGQAAAYAEGQPGSFARLTVSDSGCGMDADVVGRIFEPFFTTKDVGRGTGLGLATVYGIVKQNNGFIDVESRPGAGTTFRLFIPLTPEPLPEPVEVAEPKTQPGSGTILVVEDEKAISIMVSRMLEAAGYRVLSADCPADALEQVGKEGGGIDLLLADVVMPGMSGRELAQELVTRIPGIKCLFMSGYTADIIAHRGVIDQSVAFLAKPFTRKELLAKIRAVLDGE